MAHGCRSHLLVLLLTPNGHLLSPGTGPGLRTGDEEEGAELVQLGAFCPFLPEVEHVP